MLPRYLAPALAAALVLGLSACGRSDAPAAAAPAAPAPAEVPVAPVPAEPPSKVPEPTPSTRWQPAPLQVPEGARDALLAEAVEAEKAGRLIGTAPSGALDLYLALAGAEPPMPEAEVGRDRVLAELVARFEGALLAGRIDEAMALARVLDAVATETSGGRADALARARRAAESVMLGDARLASGRFVAPSDDSALVHYRAALGVFPGFEPAQAGLGRLEQALIARSTDALARGDLAAAEADLVRAGRVGANPGRVQDAAAVLAQARAAMADAALAEARDALGRLDLARAAEGLAEAKAVDPQAPGIDDLAQRLATARHYGHFRPGQRFADRLADGGDGPAMVVVPHGRFRMGAGEGEAGARENEGPAREVRFERGFALAVHETTVADFARFVAATGYRTRVERSGRSSAYDERGGAMIEVRGANWRRSYLGRVAAPPDAPVVHVAWEDAHAYAEWLSARTGQRYRLPSEAEFEYALRAGAQTPWAWGAQRPERAFANLTGEGDESPQGRRWGRAIPGWSDGHWGPAPVGTYPAEGFGTRDLIGNVSEWVDDCWHDSYRRAPVDGSAWINPGCDERVVRGGSWASTLEQTRSSFRLQVPGNLGSARVGFRVARDL